MEKRIAAIILAAGFSSRMGEFKPLLPLGDSTVLERVVTLFHDAGIRDVRVVVGHRHGELLPLLVRLDACPVLNKRFHEGMFTSVVSGVESLESDINAFFLLPVDIPLVKSFTVRTMLGKYSGSGPSILYPCFCGKHGHPPLIQACHRDGILCWNGEGGLKSYLSRFEAESGCVDIADETILADMDTPEDYRRLHAMWERREIPSVPECEALLRIASNGEERLLAHCRAVARLASFLTEKLNMAGCTIDRDMVVAAALLHDLAKGRRGHASAGADELRAMGYPGVADIVESHMVIAMNENDAINGKEIVYLADKMMSGDCLVSVEDRFRSRMESSAADVMVHEAVKGRLRNAQRIKKRMENLLGKSFSDVLKDFQVQKTEWLV
jgi:molybdenum cofactor cytidylyltransferase